MSEITARVPLLTWDQDFKKYWNGDNPSATHAFDALSFMFPQGERFAIKVAKEVNQQKGLSLTPELKEDVRVFILQEATHTKHHNFYNSTLEKHGYENVAYNFNERLEKMGHKYFSPIQKLASVSAYEHYTTIIGNWLLKNPEVLKSAPKHMSLPWEWHAAEETEHRAVCFDLHKAAGGSALGRVLAFLVVTVYWLMVYTRLYISMLWRDGCLSLVRLPKTTWQSLRFFWGGKGVGWNILFYGPRYLSPVFHPWKKNNKHLLDSWLIRNDDHLRKLSKVVKC